MERQPNFENLRRTLFYSCGNMKNHLAMLDEGRRWNSEHFGGA